MDNLKEALKYAVDLSAPHTYDINGETFSSEPLVRIGQKQEDLVTALEISTLTGFIDYIANNRDEIDLSKTLVIINDIDKVSLISIPNKDKNREIYIQAKAVTPEHRWGWSEREDFIIGIQSKFTESDDRDILMKYVGTMQEEQNVQTTDDGVSQKIVAKTGIASVSNVILPNPVKLRPFRTFQEVEQVESNFVFRIRQGGDCALFEADGGEWKIRCRKAIKGYLKGQLKDISEIIIIG